MFFKISKMCVIFSMRMENKANVLQIYNALNGTSYDDLDEIENYDFGKGCVVTCQSEAAYIMLEQCGLC